ncbi:hypothetical protein GGR30_001921 [Martelella radicis]|uniref:Uncharacterized protein n=1 Tax=Martelella radicis TaxID=1397476 RepID=A0A7W6KJ74_9HYPH|nr:hypothetical protein [Martelella radicis]
MDSQRIPGFRDARMIFFPDFVSVSAFLEHFPDLEYAADPEVNLFG